MRLRGCLPRERQRLRASENKAYSLIIPTEKERQRAAHGGTDWYLCPGFALLDDILRAHVDYAVGVFIKRNDKLAGIDPSQGVREAVRQPFRVAWNI